MALSPGSRIGTYEIVDSLGAGGMGEVYRARDTKLNRDVAIKVLPEAFAGDPDRLTRFTREAQTLAALNHPIVATGRFLMLRPAGQAAGAPVARVRVVMNWLDELRRGQEGNR